jgi:protein phosphatase
MTMDITIERPFAVTEKGKRNNNEDFIYPLSESAHSGQRFFMVCDGVGGAEKGEIASALVCESFHSFFNTFFEEDDPSEEFITRAVRYAESCFDEYIVLHPEANKMATTLTFLYIGTSGITIAHIGDSRIYQLREGKIIRATEDHSLVNSWVQLGKITKKEALRHPQKNVITRAIMGSEQPTYADVELITDIQPGDYFFMCTDGVSDCFTDEQLETVFSYGVCAESIKNTIVQGCADEARDNFSFYILPVQSVQKIAGYKQYFLSFFYFLA